MKVLYVSHSAVDTAGAELAMAELTKAILNSKAMTLDIVVPAEGPLQDRMTSFGATAAVVPDLTWTELYWLRQYDPTRGAAFRYGLRRCRSVARLMRLIYRNKYDVVVSNTSTIITPALAARLMRIPHVWYVQEFGEADHDLRYDIGFQRSMMMIGTLSAGVLVPSEAVRAALAQWVDPTKLRIILYAVDGPRPLPAAREDATWKLVLVGRKAPGKGQIDALDAVESLLRMNHPVKLRLVGGGDPAYIRSLMAHAERLGILPDVDFIEATHDVAPQYQWANIVLMCSRAEAFGRVTIEAMKHGRPVIGAGAAGTKELIRHGENGLLYQPGSADDLASKVVELMSDGPKMARITSAARDWAERTFSLDAYVGDFTQALRDAVGGSYKAGAR